MALIISGLENSVVVASNSGNHGKAVNTNLMEGLQELSQRPEIVNETIEYMLKGLEKLSGKQIGGYQTGSLSQAQSLSAPTVGSGAAPNREPSK